MSRSWNRIFANLVFERGKLALSLKPWGQIPETDSDDDNPNIGKYLGYGELRAAYKWHDHVFAGMGRNNLRFQGGNKGALELTWSYPSINNLRLYGQYFYG